jgi:hypothetical protein
MTRSLLTAFYLKPFCKFVNCPHRQPDYQGRGEEINPHIGKIYTFREKIVPEKIQECEYHKEVQKTVIFPF